MSKKPALTEQARLPDCEQPCLDPCEMEPKDRLDPAKQPKFKHPVPNPLHEDFLARPVFDGGTHYNLGAFQIRQWLGLEDPDTHLPLTTTVWGYGKSRKTATYPGPTFDVQEGNPVTVHWFNALVDEKGCPLPHLLPVDLSIHTPECEFECPPHAYPVPIVTHLHGGLVPSLSDGNPEAYFTPYYKCRGRLFNPLYFYPNDQGHATLWYHDHTLGLTRLNVYAGLAGFYLIRSRMEEKLIEKRRLPAKEYEQLLLIQDRSFYQDGSLFYPFEPPVPDAPCPSVQPELVGDFILVNGVIWPFMNVEPRKYRLRLLNGSNTRSYRLSFQRKNGRRMRFHVIATEQGLLPRPVEVTSIDLHSGERYEIVVDFSKLKHKRIILRNEAPALGMEPDPETVGQIMELRVKMPFDDKIPDITLPRTLSADPPACRPPQPVARVRKLILTETEDEHGRVIHLLGTVECGALRWDDPVTEAPRIGTCEVWEFYNLLPEAHPMHLHLVEFEVLNRQRFTADQATPTSGLTNIRFHGKPMPPEPYEVGAKDTVSAPLGMVTRILVKFEKWCGEYAWHCHILEHEDHEMMRPYCVVGPRGLCGDPSLDLVPPSTVCKDLPPEPPCPPPAMPADPAMQAQAAPASGDCGCAEKQGTRKRCK